MAFYSETNLDEMVDAMDKWLEREFDALTRFMIRSYRSERAHEIATHGFSRRMQGLRHCIERVFELLPPNEERPDPTIVLDVTAMLQAFLVNVYGAIDNLARIWVLESGLLGPKGRPLKPTLIGFMPTHETVRASLPANLRDALVSAGPWFAYLEDYRHALAHRVPLYIPPKVLGPLERAEADRLTVQINAAALRRDRSEVIALQVRQFGLGVFQPYMTHSFGEGAIPMRFHPQMICDFSTTITIAELTLRALDELPHAAADIPSGSPSGTLPI